MPVKEKETVQAGILRDMSEGVIVINPNGTISQINPAAERILDKNGEELVELRGACRGLAPAPHGL